MSYAPEPPEHKRAPESELSAYAWVVIDGKWTIAAVMAGFLLLAAAYLLFATPMFRGTSVVQVEPKRSGLLASVEEQLAGLGEGPSAEPEIEIITSRTLLGGVVDGLQLGTAVRPKRFPIVGAAMARWHGDDSVAEPPLGFLARYAWGGERMKIGALDVSSDLVDQDLVLTALGDGRYRLDDEDGAKLVEGEVGKTARAGDKKGRVEIVVAELVARPGTQFRVTSRGRDKVIDKVLANLTVAEKGRKTGVLIIDFEESDPVVARDVVGGIAGAYLRQNVERRSAEAAKSLEFLESQLPELKSKVDEAEGRLNAYRIRSGTVDTTAEAKGYIDRQVALEKEIADAEVQRSQLRQTFTEQHPNLVAAANKLALLKAERAQLQSRMRSVPKAEVDTARMFRELKDATDLYVALLNKTQELRVVKSGTIGDVRIIDRAYVPDEPARPRPVPVFALALMLGLCVGVAAAVLRERLVTRADTADEVEAITKLPVYVTVPHSDTQSKLARGSGGEAQPLLSREDSSDIAIEAIRSLRTTLNFALVESRNNIVTLTGPSPGVGKSFLAANLAQVLAAAGSKVLLVDCDVRRGQLHRRLGVTRRPGLSDVVSGAASLDEAIRALPGEHMSLLPTGAIPPNPAELLSSARFEAVIRQVSERFDLVIVDTPPLLAVTDAMLVARLAGVNFLVLRAGRHSLREIAAAVKEFAVNGVKLQGTVLNDVRTRTGRYGRSGYVRYDYSSDRE